MDLKSCVNILRERTNDSHGSACPCSVHIEPGEKLKMLTEPQRTEQSTFSPTTYADIVTSIVNLQALRVQVYYFRHNF